MCGIAAIYRPINRATSNERSEDIQDDVTNRLARISDIMGKRGPDGRGLYVHDGCGLAMTRLAIVGGASAQQPLWNEDGTVGVVCNGEIYNHAALRSSLEATGHTFTTTSDVEVILHLYEDYGERCLTLIEGIFALALLDTKRHRMIAARDRVGVKPLYYATVGQQTTFSSEFRALLEIDGVNRAYDANAFVAYHALRYTPSEDTIVTGIRKLRPGHCMVLEDNDCQIKRYWHPTSQDIVRNVPQRVKVNALQRKLREAVGAQVAPGVKSGVLLSGGLDSSALMGLFQANLGHALPTFTVAFEQPNGMAAQGEYSELQQAAEVASFYKSRHTEMVYGATEVLEALPHIISALDEPIADPTAIPLWFAIQLSRQADMKVVYSGEGMDELFNGYDLYRQIHWLQALHRLPRKLREALLALVARRGWPGEGVLKRSLTPASDWYRGVGPVFTHAEAGKLLRPFLDARGIALPDVRPYAREAIGSAAVDSVLRQLTYFDVFSWLPENTLVKSDKISMAQSVELRVPFLATEVVDFALSLTDRDKLRGRTGKRIVRQALVDVLPPRMTRRKKNGFPVPISAWLFNEWRNYAMSTLLGNDAFVREIYDRSEVEQLFRAEGKARPRAARLIWTLLTLELWCKHVLHAAQPQISGARLQTSVQHTAAEATAQDAQRLPVAAH